MPLTAPRRSIGVCLRQYSWHCPSSCCHTGFQYCAVDSITTSLTLRSFSQMAIRRNSDSVVPNLGSFEPQLAFARTLGRYYRQHLLMNIDSRYATILLHMHPSPIQASTGRACSSPHFSPSQILRHD